MSARIKAWLAARPYALVLLYIPCYLSYFAWLEVAGAGKEVHLIHCALDDLIPTLPVFFVPYALWWGLFPAAILYFLAVERSDFLKLCFVMFAGYTVCLLVYTVFPNGLALRTPLAGNDIFTKGVLWLRNIDTPDNVCPSMHVSSTTAIDWTVRTSKRVPRWVKNVVSVLSVLIVLSTMFLKQHSVIDVVLGAALSALLFLVWQVWLGKKV